MRAMLVVLTVAAAVAVGGAAAADEAQQSRPAADQTVEQATANPGFPVHDACFGDKYESDDDMNTGNTISEAEILAVLRPGT